MIPNNALLNYISNLNNNKFIFIPTPGKIGDALLAHSAYTLFDNSGLNYSTGTCKDIYKNENIIIGGGGNLIGHLYSELANFVNNNIAYNKITIFPHTIYNLPDVEEWLKYDTVQIFCREPKTYNYLKGFNDIRANLLLTEDMSYFLNFDEFEKYKKIKGEGTCNSFRSDGEAAGLNHSNNNFDVSQTWDGDYWHNKSLAYHAVHSMASYLSYFDTINTDRLHTAILAGIIGKNVNLFPGTYHKIESIFNFTIKNQWTNINLVTNSTQPAMK